MNTEQFFALQREHDKATRSNSLAQEQLEYVTVAIKSKFPAQYQTLIKEFEDISSEIYAKQECNSHASRHLLDEF